MNVHKNARLTPRSRERIVRQVESGQTPEAVAEAAGVCPRKVRKWVDRSELEARRLQGARLLRRGHWQQALAANGRDTLCHASGTGRPTQLTDGQKKRLIIALEAGALAQGYSTDLCTLARVGKLIKKISSNRYSESGVWRLLKGLNFSCQQPSGSAISATFCFSKT